MALKQIEVSEELWAKAKAQAALEMRELSKWMVEAIEEKLAKVAAAK